jgi:hypothetical protein
MHDCLGSHLGSAFVGNVGPNACGDDSADRRPGSRPACGHCWFAARSYGGEPWRVRSVADRSRTLRNRGTRATTLNRIFGCIGCHSGFPPGCFSFGAFWSAANSRDCVRNSGSSCGDLRCCPIAVFRVAPECSCCRRTDRRRGVRLHDVAPRPVYSDWRRRKGRACAVMIQNLGDARIVHVSSVRLDATQLAMLLGGFGRALR